MEKQKRWSDQPDVVLDGKVMMSFYVEGRSIEVRLDDSRDCYYLSFGNLFGSQTLRVANAEACMRAVHYIANVKREQAAIEPPPGCELISGEFVEED